jgi:hypothetical protein
MSKVRRVTISRGTPAEVASHANGYSGNGLSIYTRAAAAHHEPAFGNQPRRIRGAGVERTLSEKIAYERDRLRHTKAQLRIEDSAERRAKLEKSIDIKAAFIARLIAEQQREGSLQ